VAPCLEDVEPPPPKEPSPAIGPCLKFAPEPVFAPEPKAVPASGGEPQGALRPALDRPVDSVLARGVLPDDVASLLALRRG
jgi:hypothetical protein